MLIPTRFMRVVGISFLLLLSVAVVSSAAAPPIKVSATTLLANAVAPSFMQNGSNREDSRVFIPDDTSSGNVIPNSAVPSNESGTVYIPGPVRTNNTSPLISSNVDIRNFGNSSQKAASEITSSSLKSPLPSSKEPFVLVTPLSQTNATTKPSTLGALAANNNNNNNSTNAVQQQLANTLRVVTQVVCPNGFTCPLPSDFTMVVTGNNPIPSSLPGSSSGDNFRLLDGNYSVSERVPNTPQGLALFPTRITSTPNCIGSISGGQLVTCTVANVYLENKADAGDGLLNSWKVDGIPYMGVDGTLHHYKLPNANPRHKNLYIEVDYMQGLRPIGGGGDFGAIGDVKVAFRRAQVSNLDGLTGINLYVKVDDQIPLNSTTTLSSLANTIKPKWFGNATEREDPNHVNLLAAKALAFHYAVFANDQPPPNSGSSGVADLPGMNFLVTLGTWPGGGSRDQQAGTFMHELGHNFGLRHGGDFNNPNCKPNYFSVMNYLYQFRDNVASRPLDYSRSALAPLNKLNLNEPDGISQSDPANLTAIYGPVGIGIREGPGFATAGSPVDWNFNGRFTDRGVISDINAGFPGCGTPGPGTVLTGFNDWPAITYVTPLQQLQVLKIQQQTSPPENELTLNDVRQSRIVLLDGIIDAIDRAASGQKVALKEFVFEIQNFIAALKTEEPSTPNPSPAAANIENTTSTTTNIPAIPTISSLSPAVATSLQRSVDTTRIAQLLNTDQLDTANGELNKLLAQVITMSSYQSQQQQHPPQQHHHHHHQIH